MTVVAAAVHALALATSMMQCHTHGVVGAQHRSGPSTVPDAVPDAQNGVVNIMNTEDNCTYPKNCPNQVLPRADKQTWMMNRSTIIMPCNDTGFTDPRSTLGWGVVDFE
eukprot:SAG31_NODE_8797_length_1385_cov_1.890358_1_plen_109_part_00